MPSHIMIIIGIPLKSSTYSGVSTKRRWISLDDIQGSRRPESRGENADALTPPPWARAGQTHRRSLIVNADFLMAIGLKST